VSAAIVRAPARPNAVTMSTRCPAQVKRTAVTAQEGTVFGLFRLVRLLLTLLVLAWLAATAFLFVWPSTDPPGRADAVVVLSGGRDTRLDPALRLMRQHVAPVLVISGAGLDPRWHKARALCANGAHGFRVICFDPKPYSTRGEGRGIARLATQHGWTRVDVVTSRYHVFRARIVIGRCYHGRLAMIGARYPWTEAPLSWISEWGKLLVQLTVQRAC
jgi:uncharacterized SAM-binding protein YcdF (DUF218 family)